MSGVFNLVRMPQKKKATTEQVMAARRQLIAANQDVTIRALVKITGGSHSTVTAALSEIEKEEAGSVDSAQVQEAMGRLWVLARELALKSVDNRMAEMEARVTETLAEMERLEEQVGTLETEKSAVATQKDRVVEALTTAQKECDKLRAAAREDSDRAREAARLLAEAREQHAVATAEAMKTLRGAETRLAAISERLSAAELNAAREKAQLEQRVTGLTGEVSQERERASAAVSRIATLEEEVRGVRERLETERQKVEDVRGHGQSRIDALQDRIDRLNEERSLLVSQHQRELDQLHKTIFELKSPPPPKST